jgi:hypothetical protein
MSSLSLRPDHSLTILSDGFVSQLHPFRFLHESDSSYGVLTFAPAGLTPAEQTSLRWTHWVANCQMGLISAGFRRMLFGYKNVNKIS